MHNLFKLNQIFLFLVTILLVNGFIHPIPAWSAGEDPFQTEPITDDPGQSISQSIQNYQRVKVTDGTGLGLVPVSRDATGHAGDDSLTIAGASLSSDSNAFTVIFLTKQAIGATFFTTKWVQKY